MTVNVPASIPLLRWAAERARLDDAGLAKHFRKWPLWLSGDAQPTLKQLEDFARLTHTPLPNAAAGTGQVRSGWESMKFTREAGLEWNGPAGSGVESSGTCSLDVPH